MRYAGPNGIRRNRFLFMRGPGRNLREFCLQLLRFNPIVGGLKVNQFVQTVWKGRCKSCQLVTRYRMPHEIYAFDTDSVQYTFDVKCQSAEIIALTGLA